MATPAYTKSVDIHKSTGSTSFGSLPANTASLNLPANLLEVTDFTSTGFRSRIVGLKDWNITGDLFWDSGTTTVTELRDAWLNGTQISVRYLINGTGFKSTGGYVETFDLSAGVDDAETVSFTIQGNAALTTA